MLKNKTCKEFSQHFEKVESEVEPQIDMNIKQYILLIQKCGVLLNLKLNLTIKNVFRKSNIQKSYLFKNHKKNKNTFYLLKP